MGIITSQNWDGVTAPALPTGWTFQTGGYGTVWETYGSPPSGSISGHNAIGLNDNSGTAYSAYFNTPDSNNGDVVVSTAFICPSANLDVVYFGVCCRSPSITTGTSARGYVLNALFASGSSTTNFYISTDLAGGPMSGTANLIDYLATDVWYDLILTCSGTTISAAAQRLSDGLWLTSGGSWSGTQQSCISGTSSIYTSAGYAGILGAIGGSATFEFFADDFLFETIDYPPPPRTYLLSPRPDWRILNQ